MNYQKLFDHMIKEHGLTLLEGDMIEIINIVRDLEAHTEQNSHKHGVSTRDFEELYEAVKVELQIIKNLIASKRVVNLDEAIAYYESLLKKHEHHVC